MIGPEQLDINLLSKIFVRLDKLRPMILDLIKDPSIINTLISPENVLDAIRKFNEPEVYEVIHY